MTWYTTWLSNIREILLNHNHIFGGSSMKKIKVNKLCLALLSSSSIMLVACNSGGASLPNTSSIHASSAHITSAHITSAQNIVFLDNPSPQDVQNIGKYVFDDNKKPFFNEVVLFAANINGSDANSPSLYYNNYFTEILDNNISVVRDLQQKGIKVQLSYLGNHQNAGWSCNMSPDAARKLADNMVGDVSKYGLDGINIDDEWSNCSGNTQAFYNVVQAIKNNPQFANKKLSKSLWADSSFFHGETNVASLLDEGYEMTYAGDVNNLMPYVGFGMSKSNLYLGLSPDKQPQSNVNTIASNVINGGYAGVMIWAANFYLSNPNNATKYYSQIAHSEYGKNVNVIYQ